MKKILVLTMMLILAMSSMAVASGPNYVGVRGGGMLMDYSDIHVSDTELYHDEDDVVFGAGLVLGRSLEDDLGVPLRAELEYMYRSDFEYGWSETGGGDNVDVDVESNVQTLFANMYYDIDTDTDFTPFVGFGLGLARVETEWSGNGTIGGAAFNEGEEDTEYNFAWNLGLGCAYDFNKNWTMEAGYRYVDFGQGKVKVLNGSHIRGDGTSNEFLLGVRYNF
ncbi:Opacity protein [Paucidesulfovibrio gracilis DSM 16080]|uniref:Opacity protein n=1 Tax=Paucidesulfovibrio gracilis DSM 16080 TaxID=1121449 RepID=A0A1T4XL84_9BACT|nr:outer membrane beta-barrel protein [Paucidesulfovibrio gracilis]SKA90256.1 Opacity protein [Paucidesulfovibrio gracilis DSM 16080]